MNTSKQHSASSPTPSNLYFTSDGLSFFEEQNAVSHSLKLTDKSISIRTKEEIEAELQLLFSDIDEED